MEEAIRNGEISIQIKPELEQKIIKYLEVVQRISKYVGDVYEIIQSHLDKKNGLDHHQLKLLIQQKKRLNLNSKT